MPLFLAQLPPFAAYDGRRHAPPGLIDVEAPTKCARCRFRRLLADVLRCRRAMSPRNDYAEKIRQFQMRRKIQPLYLPRLARGRERGRWPDAELMICSRRRLPPMIRRMRAAATIRFPEDRCYHAVPYAAQLCLLCCVLFSPLILFAFFHLRVDDVTCTLKALHDKFKYHFESCCYR